MIRKIALTLMLSGGLLFVSALDAHAQEAPKQDPLKIVEPGKSPEAGIVAPVEVKDPEKDPPKANANQRKMGMGGDGGAGRGAGRQQAQISIFAFPGAKCPTGSAIYKGPETKLAAAENVVYCVIVKDIVVLPKTGRGCVGFLKPYNDPSVKPDDDVIWCKKIPDGPNAPAAQNGGKGKVKKVF